MKSILLAPLLGAPLLFSPPSVELAFTPEEGDALTTSCTHTWVLELVGTESSVTVDGEEVETAEVDEFDMTMKNSESIIFTDEFVEVGEERVLELNRTFDEIEGIGVATQTDPDGTEHEEETPGMSALEATTVWFRWDEDDEAYSVRFDEEVVDPDPELLEELEATADLTWFLPEGAVEEGDEWEIDVEAFHRVSALSGDPKLVYEDDDPDDDFDDQFDEHLDGELQGELVGFRTADDRRLAVIHVTAELETYVEQEAELEAEEAEGTRIDRYEFTFELEGELTWDVEEGRAVRFRLEGDVEMEMVQTDEYSGEGHVVVLQRTESFEGTVVYEVAVD